jgi:tRNA nucleotidyltransferase/poly(A) polymerase
MAHIKNYSKFKDDNIHQSMWDIIPISVKELHSLFKKNGKKLYVVGGAVRDFLNQEKPKDFDLCTDAFPDEVLSILGNKYKTNLQGKAFGVVVVYTTDEPSGMEIATFREDISKGRNPEVKLGATIEDDTKRRDLTYNALFYDLDTKEIVDTVGGVDDMKSKITRMVGDPYERIDEDSLRILRIFRFACRYNHEIDPFTIDAIKKRNQLENIDPETGLMKRVSQERIWEEIQKAWKQSKDFSEYLDLFNEFDMWEQIFPGSKINVDIERSKYFEVYMANLFYFEDTKNLLNKLTQSYKFPIEIARKVVFLNEFLQFLNGSLLNSKSKDFNNILDIYKKRKIADISNKVLFDWYLLYNVDDNCNKIFNAFMKFSPTVSAEDLMERGFKGKELGDEIKKLEIEKFKKLVFE